MLFPYLSWMEKMKKTFLPFSIPNFFIKLSSSKDIIIIETVVSFLTCILFIRKEVRIMKLLFTGLIRGGIPLIIMSSIALLLRTQEKYFEAKSTFLVGLISFFVGSATVIYQIDSWSLLKQSIVHFFLMLLTIFPILIFSGWFQLDSKLDVLKVFGLFLFVGILLWSGIFLIRKTFSI